MTDVSDRRREPKGIPTGGEFAKEDSGAADAADLEEAAFERAEREADEYYSSLQMGLPALYYSGRERPPHPEIWMEYFLRMVQLYAQKTSELVNEAAASQLNASLSHLSPKERAFYEHLLDEGVEEFAPIDAARAFGVTNRTVINWSAALAEVGLLEPQLVKQRIRSYRVVRL